MTFSVLMTVYKYDSAAYFDQALSSITSEQERTPDEVILVCDGPLSLELEQVISRHSKLTDYLGIVRLEDNVGQGKALNYGLERCSNELVARMDSDDISLPSRFKEQIGFMENHPGVDVLSSTIEEFSKSFRNLRTLPCEHDAIVKLLATRSPVNHGCCVYRKSMVLKAGGYSGLFQCQDYLLWIDMLIEGARFHNLHTTHMKVRMEEGYSRKIGWNYAKEELYLQKYMYRVGVIPLHRFIFNTIWKAGGRLLPEKVVSYVYRKFYR